MTEGVIEHLIIIAHPYRSLVDGVLDSTPSTYVNGIEREHVPGENTAAIIIPSRMVDIERVANQERMLAGTLQAQSGTRLVRALRLDEDITSSDYSNEAASDNPLRRALQQKGLTLAREVDAIVEGSESVTGIAARRVLDMLPEVTSVYEDRSPQTLRRQLDPDLGRVARLRAYGFYAAEVAGTEGRFVRIGRRSQMPPTLQPKQG